MKGITKCFLIVFTISFQAVCLFPKNSFGQRFDTTNNSSKASNVIKKVYRYYNIIPSKKYGAFSSYHIYLNKHNNMIKLSCLKKIDHYIIKYVVVLRDTANIFDKSSFSSGDNYEYIDSYFLLNNKKLSLSNLQVINNNDNFLVKNSDVWDSQESTPTIKFYKLSGRDIFLIRGVDNFCNGRNCSDYILYVLQTWKGQSTINAIYFNGKNYPYDFNYTELFTRQPKANPEILIPKGDKFVKSISDFNFCEIEFRKLKINKNHFK